MRTDNKDIQEREGSVFDYVIEDEKTREKVERLEFKITSRSQNG